MANVVTTAGISAHRAADLKLANVTITLVHGCSATDLKFVMMTNLSFGELFDDELEFWARARMFRYGPEVRHDDELEFWRTFR